MSGSSPTITATLNGKRIELTSDQAEETILWFVEQVVKEEDCRKAIISLLSLSKRVHTLRSLPPGVPQVEQVREQEQQTFHTANDLHTDLLEFLLTLSEEFIGIAEGLQIAT